MPIPLLLVGDAPFGKTGLSRILTDLLRGLTGQFHPDGQLPAKEGRGYVPSLADEFDIGTVGYQPWAHLPLSGIPIRAVTPNDYMVYGWQRHWIFSDLTNHGREAVSTAYRAWFGDRPGIVLSIWDPGRCHAFTTLDLPVQKWGYFAIDAANMNGGISGPAAEAVRAYDRVLAYTQFGKRVLETATDKPIDVLPHGIDLSVFTRDMTAEERAAGIARIFPAGYREGTMVLGCVATNQPRKDLGLFVRVLRELRYHGLDVHGWLHTDRLISEAWSIPQLAADAGLTEHLTVTTQMNDRELAVCYSLCVATIAPGRGEGFGYPIVESQACGVVAFHANYGGGVELTHPSGVVPVDRIHLEGPYAQQRPIVNPNELAFRIMSAIGPYADDFDTHRNFVKHLDWPTLWPAWEKWFRDGLSST